MSGRLDDFDLIGTTIPAA